MTDKEKAQYEAWLQRVRAAGKQLAEYACPHCSSLIYTLVPEPGDTYDTMVSCLYCGKLHFKIVEADGTVTIEEAAIEDHDFPAFQRNEIEVDDLIYEKVDGGEAA